MTAKEEFLNRYTSEQNVVITDFFIPDEDTRWIVEKIFQMAAHGVGVAKINRTLVAEKVPIPSWWHRDTNGRREFFENADESEKYKWAVVTIKHILENKMFIGNLELIPK